MVSQKLWTCSQNQVSKNFETNLPNHGQATDMDMKAFEDFWKIFAIGNFKKP